MYSYEILPSLQRILNKLSKKDRRLYEQVLKKIGEVLTCFDVEHYKNLRYDMKDKKIPGRNKKNFQEIFVPNLPRANSGFVLQDEQNPLRILSQKKIQRIFSDKVHTTISSIGNCVHKFLSTRKFLLHKNFMLQDKAILYPTVENFLYFILQ